MGTSEAQSGITYRGIYRHGLVRLEGEVELRNGSHVEVNVVPAKKKPAEAPKGTRRAASSRKPATTPWDRAMRRAGKMSKQERIAAFEAAYGMYKDRPDWKDKSTVQIAAELRIRASRRGRIG